MNSKYFAVVAGVVGLSLCAVALRMPLLHADETGGAHYVPLAAGDAPVEAPATPDEAKAKARLAHDAWAILDKNCSGCHTENSEDYIGEMPITNRQTLLDSQQLKPGQPDTSGIYTRLVTTNARRRMPKAAPPLAAADVAIIRAWIAANAPDRPAPTAATEASAEPGTEPTGTDKPVEKAHG